MRALLVNELHKLFKGKFFYISNFSIILPIIIFYSGLILNNNSLNDIKYLSIGQALFVSINQSVIQILGIIFVSLVIVDEYRMGTLKQAVIFGVNRTNLINIKWVSAIVYLILLNLNVFLMHTGMYILLFQKSIPLSSVALYFVQLIIGTLPMMGFLSVIIVLALWIPHTIGHTFSGLFYMLILQIWQTFEGGFVRYNIYNLLNFSVSPDMRTLWPYVICLVYVVIGWLLSIIQFRNMDLIY